MTPEKKAQIRKRITIIEIALMALLLAYLAYGIATKTTDQPMFNALAIFVVVAYENQAIVAAAKDLGIERLWKKPV